MTQIAVITTGSTAAIGTARTKATCDLITANGGRLRFVSSPQSPRLLPKPMRVLEEITALGLWGLHHSGIPISRRTLQARVGFRQRMDEQIAPFISAGWLRAKGTDSSQPGRPIPTYTLTQKGQLQGARRFGSIFQGSLVAAEFNEMDKFWKTTNKLRHTQGLIVRSNEVRLDPVPYEIWTLVLMVSWVLAQSEQEATIPEVAKRLMCEPSSVRSAMEVLIREGLAAATGAELRHRRMGRPPTWYRLTNRGMALAYQHQATLLT